MTPREAASGRRPVRAALVAPLLLFAALAACRHDYGVERREAQVHVWLDVPAARSSAQAVDLAVAVGGRTVADGRFDFPGGQTLIELPTAYVAAGNTTVVVTRGGRTVASTAVRVDHVAFVRVRVDGGAVSVTQERREPGSAP
jgi:hypothetical protein